MGAEEQRFDLKQQQMGLMGLMGLFRWTRENCQIVFPSSK